ncbi:hypothetical protein K504DRAFT_139929 [Pleomassaria siparia CBS 279.74]|uniref:Uncharacterized protein n=1 Tax=Pleomassaria siparia CBS 279.74 TaxID=1314801 RepID=A0A6G1KL24_9PLEO|nr:hypothetical protein K504DRAFT_139929 [Pleomassaria siparia CBS 279.74]
MADDRHPLTFLCHPPLPHASAKREKAISASFRTKHPCILIFFVLFCFDFWPPKCPLHAMHPNLRLVLLVAATSMHCLALPCLTLPYLALRCPAHARIRQTWRIGSIFLFTNYQQSPSSEQ